VMFYYRGDQLFAVRKGTYKAHWQTAPGYVEGGKQLKFEPHDPPLLYELGSDPGEKFNVAGEHSDVIADIQREVEKHRAGLVPGKPQY
jgi:arylsulfatase A